MNKQIFVGGLDWNTSNEGIHSTFSAIGPIEEAKVITDRDSGRSRGFAFVTFANQSHAQQAVETLDGTMIDGRAIRVNWAESRSPRPRH